VSYTEIPLTPISLLQVDEVGYIYLDLIPLGRVVAGVPLPDQGRRTLNKVGSSLLADRRDYLYLDGGRIGRMDAALAARNRA